MSIILYLSAANKFVVVCFYLATT